MRKADEIAFYALARAARARGVAVRDTISSPQCPVPGKRAHYLLNKWATRGWYDYGVSLDLGWFTANAPATL